MEIKTILSAILLAISVLSCKSQNHSETTEICYQLDSTSIDWGYLPGVNGDTIFLKDQLVILEKKMIIQSAISTENTTYNILHSDSSLYELQIEDMVFNIKMEKTNNVLIITSRHLPKEYMTNFKEEYIVLKQKGFKIWFSPCNR